jgi:hypothetical protein
MSVAWSLEYDGEERSLAAWGIAGALLTFRSLDTDELRFHVTQSDRFAAPAFAYGEQVILRRDDVIVFRGQIALPTASAGARDGRESYTAYGPWWELERIVYQQGWKVRDSGFGAIVNEDTTKVVLGQDEFGQTITAGAQITAIITYALTRGAALGPGTVPAFLDVPKQEERDITCAEAIRKMLLWSPQSVSWFDYSGSTPVLNIQQRSVLSEVALDLEDGDRVFELEIGPRHDLVPPGVTFIYPQAETNDGEEGDGRTYTRITRDSAGSPNAIGAIIATIDLGGAGTETPEAPPTGLAAAYYAELQVLGWEGTLRLLEAECGADLRPGLVLNLDGGKPAWEDMRALIQIVTQDIAQGETVVTVGPPQHLAPQDFVAQQQFLRRRPKPTLFPQVQHNGSEGAGETIENDDAGVDPAMLEREENLAPAASIAFSTLSLKYCDEGEEQTVTVYGPPIGG